MTNYHKYRAKARKWDKLISFLSDPNMITDSMLIDDDKSMFPPRLLRMSKDKTIYKRGGTKMLAGLDIV